MPAQEEWQIKDLKIENFKSIKSQSLKCKKFNLFLGKPNVGKSNVLEAVSLLGGYNSAKEKYFSEFIRYEKTRNLYYDNDRNLELLVQSNLGYVYSRYHMNNINQYDFLFGSNKTVLEEFKVFKPKDYSIATIKNHFDPLLQKYNISPTANTVYSCYFTLTDFGTMLSNNHLPNTYIGNIKKYHFENDISPTDKFSSFLKVPSGNNIFALLEANPTIFEEVAAIFKEYNLSLLFDSSNDNSLEVQKIVGHRSYKFPYSLCADTLKRYIFHLLAVKTNRQSVILLEEPEAHCFPRYISNIAETILKDSENQYFIATHSSYLLREFIEKTNPNDLAVFVTRYDNFQTTFKELSQNDIQEITDKDVEFFYNIEAFS